MRFLTVVLCLSLILCLTISTPTTADVKKESFKIYPPLTENEVLGLLAQFWYALNPKSIELPPSTPGIWLQLLQAATPGNALLDGAIKSQNGGSYLVGSSFPEAPMVQKVTITLTKKRDDITFWCLSFDLKVDKDPQGHTSTLSIRFHRKKTNSTEFKTVSRRLENRATFPKGLSVWHFRYDDKYRVKSFKKYRDKSVAKILFELLSPSPSP